MALAIGVWAIVLGYAIAWAGWRNFQITYSANSQGQITPSATPVTLLGALTGKDLTSSSSSSNSSTSTSGGATGYQPPDNQPYGAGGRASREQLAIAAEQGLLAAV